MMTVTEQIPIKDNDNLWIRICMDDKKINLLSYEYVFVKFFNSFIPAPDKLRLQDGSEYAIDGFLDPKILAELALKLNEPENSIQTVYQNESNTMILDPDGTIYVEISASFINREIATSLCRMLREIAAEIKPYFIASALQNISSHIYRQHFEWQDRSWHSPSLVWLQYFGPHELKKQGGEAIFNNPFIKAEKLGEGIFIQVGNNPFDAYSSEGESLLVKATEAMPKVAVTSLNNE